METGNRNFVRHAIRDGKRVTAAWAQAASSITAEILADACFDVVIIDMEHGPGDVLTLIGQIHALQGKPAIPFVRTPWNDTVAIKRILDAGAYGLLVPYVNTRAEAEAAVAAALYPPDGVRGMSGSPRAPGYGRNPGYFAATNEELFLMTAIETPEAVANVEELLQVDRLDALFIGPMDLASSMGFHGDSSRREVQSAIRSVEEKVLGSSKALGTVATSWEDAQKKFDRGYQLLVLMSDTVSLGKQARAIITQFTDLYPDR